MWMCGKSGWKFDTQSDWPQYSRMIVRRLYSKGLVLSDGQALVWTSKTRSEVILSRSMYFSPLFIFWS